MALQLVIPSTFGVISCRFDEDAEGVDGYAKATAGAVTSLKIGEPIVQEFKMHSGTCGFGSDVRTHLLAWMNGEPEALLRIGVAQPGTPFKQAVWRAMRQIPAGAPVSYVQLAVMAGNAGAVRAAASACATNQVPLIVPCHRVIKSDGSIGNYYWGSEMKQQLLHLEAAMN